MKEEDHNHAEHHTLPTTTPLTAPDSGLAADHPSARAADITDSNVKPNPASSSSIDRTTDASRRKGGEEDQTLSTVTTLSTMPDSTPLTVSDSGLAASYSSAITSANISVSARAGNRAGASNFIATLTRVELTMVEGEEYSEHAAHSLATPLTLSDIGLAAGQCDNFVSSSPPPLALRIPSVSS